ncbi:MAG: hypothetical protein LBM12_02675 [Candidatus Nomurabacteria bacterium]|jgi:uncharacterized protein YrrD|nr:hypothetical protein [Candidatus Nomurabacteria bacterium]
MLYYNSGLIGLPVREARSGDTVALVEGLIIDPRSFTLAAFQVNTGEREPSYLVADSVAEITLRHGIFFTDTDAVSKLSELPRLQEVLNLGFNLLKLPVRTSGDEKLTSQKLGSVADFVVDSLSFAVFQVIVKRGIFGSFLPELAIGRGQIIELTNHELIVEDAYAKSPEPITPQKPAKPIKPQPVAKPQTAPEPAPADTASE